MLDAASDNDVFMREGILLKCPSDEAQVTLVVLYGFGTLRVMNDLTEGRAMSIETAIANREGFIFHSWNFLENGDIFVLATRYFPFLKAKPAGF